MKSRLVSSDCKSELFFLDRPHVLRNLFGRTLGCLIFVLGAVNHGSASDSMDERESFFETHIRPLLIERCIECHGPEDQSGELRLDSPPDFNRSDGSGPVLVPGQPEQSLLIKAIKYNDSSIQMPPDGKLSPEEIELLTQWVQQGAYWAGADSTDAATSPSLPPSQQIDALRQTHWAYQPIVAPTPPNVNDRQWPKQPIDQFILSKLEETGIAPNPIADRRTLILRAYFTLIGLPPTYEQVEAFLSDTSPDAFSKMVDHLLESPHYGERWARHWLDLARFAETTGYLAGSVDTTYPYAYTYRDYVINAFNQDKPFDRFIVEQIAADQLPLHDRSQDALAALGFLTVGRKFMNRTHDIIDDRIDVVTRGFLAQSVSCARCHDHKYDPIPSADYYSLYGVFASTHEPAELPLLGQPDESPLYHEFLEARAEKQREVDDWLEKKRVATEDELRSRVADYLVYAARTLPGAGGEDVQQKGRRGVLRPPAIQRWKAYLEQHKDQTHPVWSIWHRLASIEPTTFAQVAPQVLSPADEGAELQGTDPGLLSLLRSLSLTSMVDVAESMGGYLESAYANWKELQQASASEKQIDDEALDLAEVILSAQAPTTLDSSLMLGHLNQAERDEYNRQLSKVKAVESKHPGAPGRAMVVVENDSPHEPVVFLRGQPGNRGDRVPRRFLQVLSHVDGGQPFEKGSGRLELALAIASPKNPLTPRVIVNRIWQQHFGFGLVRTSSDFGSRGEPPSHPELLDHLAAELIADGWSLKRLHRRIMLSATWQQSSAIRPEILQIDPENSLLWHNPRRRLEFEPYRDRMLMTSGQLDSTVGGRSVMIHHDGVRRGLYAYVDREDVPSLLASFDVPSPDASQAIRSRTTVPQQALYLINSEFIFRQAEALAARIFEEDSNKFVQAQSQSREDGDSTQWRIVSLYRRALARDPDPQELALATSFIHSSQNADQAVPTILQGEPRDPPVEPSPAWVQLCQVLLASNEFAFVD